MKAIALQKHLPIEHPESLIDIDLPKPQPAGRDLLVAIKAISVNPVDTKVRSANNPPPDEPRVLGWDASGIVEAVGPDVTFFKPGDKVFYAGDLTRPGSNSEFQLVDERIVGPMPASLSFEEAAALPLTAITAWEALFDRLKVAMPVSALPRRSILIIGAAGGVGSIGVQLAAKIAGLDVIATASRPKTEQWVRDLGARHVVNHQKDVVEQVRALGYRYVDYVLILNNTDQHFNAAAELILPQGMICTIVENKGELDVGLLKSKSAGFIWEFMFTRSMFQTPDMAQQNVLLTEIARLIDQGILRTTVQQVLSPIHAQTLRQAHAMIESGKTIGKIVLKDF
ncbi:zinc-binding alcohol dehydrogenase family protein [Oxalobacteraceae bacterium R-40]|uniref:Zinc-type alcohol dehydrogenase-like protein n=1 Tax=Keguizhuia sedimenti TaxID=3064264 RepID=A0ABU1BN77_9BURK|nr:zinc-binding alcohol dehydrogenase family protein [Oxalobacteraceae bacterium R-40]